MALMRPDPTFYPSPGMAMQAPPERLAYVALLNVGKNGKHDAMGVIDLDPNSSEYGRLVGQVDFPRGDNELHHFGWNACSACLCPQAPHPHMERRYLIVPGIGSSRIHILDTKPNPRQPKIVKVIEPEEFIKKTGYTSPHTIHCGPDGVYGSALGSASGDGPGGIFLMDANTFELKGQWEKDRGPQQLAYDFWWHLGHDTMITSEWGTPNMVKDGVNPELLLAGKYGHKLHVWDLDKRRHLQEIDLGAEQQMVLELRPSHDPKRPMGLSASSFRSKTFHPRSGCGIAKSGKGKNGKWAVRKVIEIPAEPADPEKLPPLLKGFKAVPPLVSDINLSLDDRFLYVSCWGTGEFIQYDVSDPANPKKTGSVHLGGIVRRAAHPKQAQAGAQRRSADGRDQPRRQARLFHQLALLPVGRAVLSRRREELDGEARRRPEGRDDARRKVLRRVRRAARAPGAAGRRRRLVRFLLLLGARNDARGDGLDGVVADAAPRRLPRNQSRDGLALRGGAGDAGAEGERGSEIARPHRARPRAGHRRRGAGCRVSRHGAAARRHPLSRRRDPVRSRNLLAWCGIITRAGSACGSASGT